MKSKNFLFNPYSHLFSASKPGAKSEATYELAGPAAYQTSLGRVTQLRSTRRFYDWADEKGRLNSIK